MVQTSGMKTCFQILECSLSYAKIVQGERNGTCSKLLSRSQSYAKLQQKLRDITKFR